MSWSDYEVESKPSVLDSAKLVPGTAIKHIGQEWCKLPPDLHNPSYKPRAVHGNDYWQVCTNKSYLVLCNVTQEFCSDGSVKIHRIPVTTSEINTITEW